MVEWNSHVDFFVGALNVLANMFVSYLDSYIGFLLIHYQLPDALNQRDDQN